MAIVALLFCQHNPFYIIRRYATCGLVQEDEEHPFDEVDSTACAPRPVASTRRTEGRRKTTFVWVRSTGPSFEASNLSYKVKMTRYWSKRL
jgi:hypothetical protein